MRTEPITRTEKKIQIGNVLKIVGVLVSGLGMFIHFWGRLVGLRSIHIWAIIVAVGMLLWLSGILLVAFAEERKIRKRRA
jgi:uncharacterized membrane protein